MTSTGDRLSIIFGRTPLDKLSSLRSQTNAFAAERVKLAIRAVRAAQDAEKDASSNDTNGAPRNLLVSADDIECLTIAEEQKLVEYYCVQCVELGKFFEFPINVIATAVQFLKRFYLSNSPMTYHPKQIMPSALFLATKTENNHIYLKDYVSRLSSPKKTVTPEDILAPEFIITQGLRFTFDVRHPHRGLKGGYMELLALASGKAAMLPSAGKSAADLAEEMRRLPLSAGGGSAASNSSDGNGQNIEKTLERRLESAYGRANEILRSAAVLTDAYFLFSPAQIWLGALLLVDEPLTLFYIDTKLPSSNGSTSNGVTIDNSNPASYPNSKNSHHPPPPKNKVLDTIRSCATLLKSNPSSNPSSSSGSNTQRREELVRIDKKLYQCRNPEKTDLVAINKAQKRDGVAEDGALDGSVAKKRKLREGEA